MFWNKDFLIVVQKAKFRFTKSFVLLQSYYIENYSNI